MNKIVSEKLMFYQYLNGDTTSKELEQWIYNTPSLEIIFTAGHYHDLISFNFKSSNTTTYIKSLVKKFFCINEYELWRTITLLTDIKEEKIELVLATREMRRLFIEQEETISTPFISIKLAIGYESLLENCPIEIEYNQHNKHSLQKQLEPIQWYKAEIMNTVDEELSRLLNN